jgi:long-chain acyl-CoA synthetase
LTQLFFEAVERHDKPNALQVKAGGSYQPISHRALAERVRNAALGLRALGIARGERVAILSHNRPEWAIADFGTLTAGTINVPVYPTLTPEQTAYILRDAQAVAVFVADEKQAAKVASVRGETPALRHIISFGPTATGGADLTLADLESRGAATATTDVSARYRADALDAQPHDVATVIYTSGTTGNPKGVELTHDNIYSNVLGTLAMLPEFGLDDVALSFLPLSHSLERTCGHFAMFHAGASIAYAESVDAVPANMMEVRPTIVVSVPRLYEKMYAKVLERALSSGALKRRIFLWASGVAERWARRRLSGERAGILLSIRYGVAQRLVFRAIRARTGGRLRFFVSGGAPLAADINLFFYASGLLILEGYGLTETSPVLTCNTPRHLRIGTVGRPIPGVELTIADDGEVLARGPGIMRDYLNLPDATADAIDRAGWFHTGDIGEITDGFLKITDRKKDLIVTAGGKKIAPQPIENRIKGSAFVAQAVMLGDRRKFAVVLIVPNFDQLERFARQEGLAWTDRTSLLRLPAVVQKIDAEVTQSYGDLSRFETPKKIALVENDFTIERGELTPSMKVKRKVVEEHYRSLIDALYEEADGEG